ncbi:MAG: hypothetical protein ACE5DI_06490 [Candidatus Micrarchaeia archaeon]
MAKYLSRKEVEARIAPHPVSVVYDYLRKYTSRADESKLGYLEFEINKMKANPEFDVNNTTLRKLMDEKNKFKSHRFLEVLHAFSELHEVNYKGDLRKLAAFMTQEEFKEKIADSTVSSVIGHLTSHEQVLHDPEAVKLDSILEKIKKGKPEVDFKTTTFKDLEDVLGASIRVRLDHLNDPDKYPDNFHEVRGYYSSLMSLLHYLSKKHDVNFEHF